MPQNWPDSTINYCFPVTVQSGKFVSMIDTPVGESADRQIAGLQDQIKRLQRAVEELSVLNDLARAIGASSNSEEVIGIITRRSLKAVNAEQGVITLTNEQAMDTSKTLI